PPRRSVFCDVLISRNATQKFRCDPRDVSIFVGDLARVDAAALKSRALGAGRLFKGTSSALIKVNT
ncbi:MAG: hypothetical protein ACPGSK_05395, partial [Alphaproteobacteria bacterium]